MDWNSLNWNTLDRLRATFLAEEKSSGPYWTSAEDLANYNFTYARRIGWKWDALLRDLAEIGWRPPGGPLLDWGCGSGIASRTVVEHFGAGSFSEAHLFDHSALAISYAGGRMKKQFPELPIVPENCGDGNTSAPIGTLVLSHVLNELSDAAIEVLKQLCRRAETILWLEPGTHSASHRLISFREELRNDFHIISPCPHQRKCGLLAKGNERHWCHLFAEPPHNIMANSDWVKFAQRAGIDLRSLPYSCLVLDRRVGQAIHSGGKSAIRIIGRPRIYKSFARVFACRENGVEDLEAWKRNVPEFFKACKKGTQQSRCHLDVTDGKIVRHEEG